MLECLGGWKTGLSLEEPSDKDVFFFFSFKCCVNVSVLFCPQG